MKMHAKRITMGIMTCCLAASLFVGCGDGAGTSSGSGTGSAAGSSAGSTAGSAAPAKVTFPEREATSTTPVETFKIGDREGKVYELANFDDKSLANNSKMVVMGKALYYHSKAEGAQNTRLVRVDFDKETLSAPVILHKNTERKRLATNGKIVVFRTADGKCAVYDGQKVTEGSAWIGTYLAGGAGDTFYLDAKDGISEVSVSESGFGTPKPILDNYRKEPYNLKSIIHPIYGDEKGVYFEAKEKKADGSSSDLVPLLFYCDKAGKEIRRFTGIEKLPRGWVVTANYVIHAASKGAFRVFDRETGALITELNLHMRPFDVALVKGNDVLVYDDRANKLYRIDF